MHTREDFNLRAFIGLVEIIILAYFIYKYRNQCKRVITPIINRAQKLSNKIVPILQTANNVKQFLLYPVSTTAMRVAHALPSANDPLVEIGQQHIVNHAIGNSAGILDGIYQAYCLPIPLGALEILNNLSMLLGARAFLSNCNTVRQYAQGHFKHGSSLPLLPPVEVQQPVPAPLPPQSSDTRMVLYRHVNPPQHFFNKLSESSAVRRPASSVVIEEIVDKKYSPE